MDGNYPAVEVSFGQTLLRHNIKKASSNPPGSGEYLLWQERPLQNCNKTNPPNGVFCALLIPLVYTSDFETETEGQLSTQVRSRKSHSPSKSCGDAFGQTSVSW